MKRFYTLFLLLATIHLNAQFPFGGGAQAPVIKGKVEGFLLDSISKQPVGFASLVLRKAGSQKDLDGIISGENGKFTFENVKTGKYDIIIVFIGYNDKKIANVETTLKNPDLNLQKVDFAPNNVVLDEVVVKEQRSMIENKVDRIVYNAENDASVAGQDATAVLRKVPMLTVDLNGNVSMRGSQNVRILINGKPSGMFSTNVGDALKMFPADQIKKVEVITSPSAKYDGEGTGGIINIITSKQNIDGLAGSVNASVGIRQNSLFTNLNAGKGRLGFSSSAAIFYSNPAKGGLTFERLENTSSGTNTFTQSGDQTTSRLGGNGNASLFYDFNGYNSINSSLNFRGFGFDVKGLTNGLIDNKQFNFQDVYARTNDGSNFMGGFDWNTDYTMKFEKHKDREFSVAAQYTRDNNNQNFDVAENHSYLTMINRDAQIINDGKNNEYTLQADYTHPIKNGAKLEAGAKTVIRDINSDYKNNIKDANGKFVTLGEFSDVFNYNQSVNAAYASLNYILAKKYNFITGLRYEGTKFDLKYASSDAKKFGDNYYNLLPNFTVSRNLPNFKSIKLSYTQRIQRPSLTFINPFINNTDYLNRTIGNPELKPELTDQIELGYNTNFKGFTIFSAVYFKRTTDIIEQILAINNGVSENTYQNIGRNNSYGVNLFTTKTIKQLTVRGGGNFFTYDSKGVVSNQTLQRSTYEYNLFFNGEYSFTGSLKADFFGFFKSPKRSIQGDQPAFSIYGMGFRKDFKNSSLGLTLIQPHTNNLVFSTNIKGDNYSQVSAFSIPFRSIGINFRYKFGNVDFKERKTKIKNNDMKTDDTQQGGGGATPRNQ